MYSIIKKSTALLLAIVLALPVQLFAQVLPYMPPVGTLTLTSAKYDLPTLKGIRFDKNNPFKFTFFFNKSDLPLTEGVLKEQAEKIGKYFLAALTIDEKDLWVNLSPYESNRIIPDKLGQTDLGKDMLGEDYVLKQLAASLTHPDTPQGKEYWNALQDLKSQISNLPSKDALGGQRSNEQSEFQKVWIIPDKIHIYESPSMVVIDYARLKVLTDTDYLATQINHGRVGADLRVGPKQNDNNSNNGRNIGPPLQKNTDAFKKYILPTIEKEVNEGKQFAHLRQLYSAIILAMWFKDKLKDSILNSTYFGKGKIKGADANDPNIKQKIYDEYVKAFNTGAYNMVKTERALNKITKRQYFCGGMAITQGELQKATVAESVPNPVNERVTSGMLQTGMVMGGLTAGQKVDLAMRHIRPGAARKISVDDAGILGRIFNEQIPYIIASMAKTHGISSEDPMGSLFDAFTGTKNAKKTLRQWLDYFDEKFGKYVIDAADVVSLINEGVIGGSDAENIDMVLGDVDRERNRNKAIYYLGQTRWDELVGLVSRSQRVEKSQADEQLANAIYSAHSEIDMPPVKMKGTPEWYVAIKEKVKILREKLGKDILTHEDIKKLMDERVLGRDKVDGYTDFYETRPVGDISSPSQARPILERLESVLDGGSLAYITAAKNRQEAEALLAAISSAKKTIEERIEGGVDIARQKAELLANLHSSSNFTQQNIVELAIVRSFGKLDIYDLVRKYYIFQGILLPDDFSAFMQMSEDAAENSLKAGNVHGIKMAIYYMIKTASKSNAISDYQYKFSYDSAIEIMQKFDGSDFDTAAFKQAFREEVLKTIGWCYFWMDSWESQKLPDRNRNIMPREKNKEDISREERYQHDSQMSKAYVLLRRFMDEVFQKRHPTAGSYNKDDPRYPRFTPSPTGSSKNYDDFYTNPLVLAHFYGKGKVRNPYPENGIGFKREESRYSDEDLAIKMLILLFGIDPLDESQERWKTKNEIIIDANKKSRELGYNLRLSPSMSGSQILTEIRRIPATEEAINAARLAGRDTYVFTQEEIRDILYYGICGQFDDNIDLESRRNASHMRAETAIAGLVEKAKNNFSELQTLMAGYGLDSIVHKIVTPKVEIIDPGEGRLISADSETIKIHLISADSETIKIHPDYAAALPDELLTVVLGHELIHVQHYSAVSSLVDARDDRTIPPEILQAHRTAKMVRSLNFSISQVEEKESNFSQDTEAMADEAGIFLASKMGVSGEKLIEAIEIYREVWKKVRESYPPEQIIALRAALPKLPTHYTSQDREQMITDFAQKHESNTGGLDFAEASKQNKNVIGGGAKFAFDDTVKFLQSSDFTGISLKVESVSLK